MSLDTANVSTRMTHPSSGSRTVFLLEEVLRMKAECSVRVGRQEMGVSSSDHMLSKGGDLHTYLLQFSVQMTATSTSPSALTADYDSYSSHTGFLPMKTASQYLVSSFRMPTGHRKWIQGHPWFIIPSFFHQLRGCWYTVLAGNTNICLYYMFDINNVPIYLSFDNNRQDQLSLLDRKQNCAGIE